MTKFRVGLVLGISTGYYLGAKAGRGRYQQLNRGLKLVARNRKIGQAVTAVGRARAVIDLSRERVHVINLDRPAPTAAGPAMTYVAN